MARRLQLPKFRVHTWHVVSVTQEVQAEDQVAAIDVAYQSRDWYEAFADAGGVHAAYAEDYTGACVDVVGDRDYTLTRYFESRTNVLYEPVRQLLASLDDKDAFQRQVEHLKELLRKFV